MALSHDKKTEYEVAYKVTGDDLDTTITNTADLSYTCQSHYSSGPFSGSAEARASISAKTLNLQAIVADFGLPVVLDFSGDKHGKYDLAHKGTAKYGTVSVKDNVVTYTPNRVLTRVDTVKLYNERASNTGSTSIPPPPCTTKRALSPKGKASTAAMPARATSIRACPRRGHSIITATTAIMLKK